jgi:hypothetical protein
VVCKPGMGAMEPWVLVRAGVAGMLGALIVVGAVYLGRTSAAPGLTVLREIRVLSNPTPGPGSVAAVATPGPIPTMAPSPVAAATPVAPPRVRIVGAGADEVNLRAEPGVNGARLKGLVDGAELELLGEDAEVDGRTWRHVRDPALGAEGWVAAELLGPAR